MLPWHDDVEVVMKERQCLLDAISTVEVLVGLMVSG